MPCGLQDPVAVERERRDPGEAAAAGAAVRPGRPAHDADDDGAGWLDLEHRPAGIAGTCAKPLARALASGIDQANLQAAGFAGGNEDRGTNGTSAFAVAAHGHTDARDGEFGARNNWKLRCAEHGDLFFGRRFELQQRNVGRSAVRQHRLHVELWMPGDIFYVLQLRLPVGAIFHDLVFGTSLHAMRHRQHQRRRDQRAGTEIAARTDDGDDGAADLLGRRRRTTDDGVGGGCEKQRRRRGHAGQSLHRGNR